MTLDEVIASHVQTTDAFTSALRAERDPHRPVRGLGWTVAELGAHMLSMMRANRHVAVDPHAMWPDLNNGPDHNAAFLAATAERDLSEIADAIDAEAPQLRATWRAAGDRYPWHAGMTLATQDAAAIHLGDILVHCWDIASTWHGPLRVDPTAAALVLDGVLAVTELFVDETSVRDLTATFHIRLRGDGDYGFVFEDGRLRVTRGTPADADCHVSATPSAQLLLSYQRMSPIVAGLTGQVVVYGRKPWLVSRLTNAFRAP